MHYKHLLPAALAIWAITFCGCSKDGTTKGPQTTQVNKAPVSYTIQDSRVPKTVVHEPAVYTCISRPTDTTCAIVLMDDVAVHLFLKGLMPQGGIGVGSYTFTKDGPNKAAVQNADFVTDVRGELTVTSIGDGSHVSGKFWFWISFDFGDNSVLVSQGEFNDIECGVIP